MVGRRLTDVLTLEREGLVGFTEIGEQVSLSSPKQVCVPLFPLGGKADLDEIKEDAIRALEATEDEEKFYFQIGGFEEIGTGAVVYFNSYKERA